MQFEKLFHLIIARATNYDITFQNAENGELILILKFELVKNKLGLRFA